MTNKAWTVIQNLEEDNSRLVKEGIIAREAKNNNIEFFEGVKLALDMLVTFGIKQVPVKSTDEGAGLEWDEFINVARQFMDRSLTGNAARAAVNQLMAQATKEQWNDWYRRILIKDLRCGTSEKTVNKITDKKYPQFRVPIFSLQLAHDSAKHEKKMKGKKLISSTVAFRNCHRYRHAGLAILERPGRP